MKPARWPWLPAGALCAVLLLGWAPARAADPAMIHAGIRTVEGSGNVVTETRSVAAFSQIEVAGSIDVVFTRAEKQKVTVHAEDNIAPLIETRVKDGVLTIGLRQNSAISPRRDLEVRVEAKALEAVTMQGSGDLRADHIEAPIFRVTLQGSGDVAIKRLQAGSVAISSAGSGEFRAAGRADQLGVVIAGSGDVLVDELESKDVAVRASGSGDARVHATQTLQISIAGSGDVSYRGNPRVTKSVAGSGDVNRLD